MSDHRPLVEALRLETLITRQRRVVLRLAQQLEDAEAIRRVLEAELERVRTVSRWGLAEGSADTFETPDRLPSRDGEVSGPKTAPGIDDPKRGSTVARSGGPGRQPTASSVPGDPPAASAEQLVPSGTAGVDSGGSGAAITGPLRTATEPSRAPAIGEATGGSPPAPVGVTAQATPEPAGSSHGGSSPTRGVAWGGRAKDETGHFASACPQRPPPPRRGDCPKCYSMPSRVEGERCSACGLAAEQPLRATDFTGGESALGRAIG